MQKKKILICGVTGFMGRNIYEHFIKLDKFEVYGTCYKRDFIDWKGKKLFKVDLTTKEGVDKVFNFSDYDVVVQAAATTSGSKDIIERPYIHVTDNALMNSLILRSCFETNVKHFLFLSCGVMYNPEKSPVSEKDFSLDEEIHKNYFGVGWTKVYIEKMCEFYSRLGKTKHTVIRHSNTYGPHDKYDLEKSHILGATITKVMTAKDGQDIIVWGNGLTERDLLYVEDVVEFIEKAIELQEKSFELVNVSYGESFSVVEIVKKIIKISNKNLNIKFDLTKPNIETKLSLKNDYACGIFQWKPKHNFEEGLQKTIKWYEENIRAEK